MLPYARGLPLAVANLPAQRAWYQYFLRHYCQLLSQQVDSARDDPSILSAMPTIMPPQTILWPFQLYVQLYNAKSEKPVDPHDVTDPLEVPRIYYEMISMLFRQKIVPPIFQSKRHQFQELKKAEAFYHSMLLKETKFPKADEINTPVELFIDEVMDNWRFASSPSWLEADLGEGGKAKLNQVVLDVSLSGLKAISYWFDLRMTADSHSFRSSSTQLGKLFIP